MVRTPLNDAQQEDLCIELECNANRTTEDLIKDHIKSIEYSDTTVFGKVWTHCYIQLDDGWVVCGKASVAVDNENYRVQLGREIAYANTFEKLWEHFGYRLYKGRV